MENIIRKKNSVVISLFVILCFLVIPTLTFAQKLTHIVQKGDTLWDICEQYYGDAELWPKLWEMNPFITNPHLLKEGDVITLFEKEPVKEEVKEVEAVPEEKPPVKEEISGIDIGSLTEIDAIGSFYHDKVPTWGNIFATDKDKIMLTRGETAFVIIDEGRDIKIGDKFFIGESSPLLKAPRTNKDLGYTFTVKGLLTIEERVGKGQKSDEYYEKDNVYRGVIDESFEAVSIEDALMPYKSVSSCILPVSQDKEIVANIIAAKKQLELIHTNSIVYINMGFDDGLKKGNVLNVIKENISTDPVSDENIMLPDIIIGRLMIIECEPDISTAIILSSVEPFSTGTYVKELSWDELPDFLLEIPKCPIQ